MRTPGPRITYYPPSWLRIEARHPVLYIDPAYLKKYWAGAPETVEFSSWPDAIDGLPEAGMPAADVVLFTHHHKDHCKKVTLDRLRRPGSHVLAPRSCEKEIGSGMTLVSPGSELAVEGIRIRAVNAYNTPEGRSTRKQHRKGAGVGYVLEIDGCSFYHAGDTDVVPDMKELGSVDIAFLPVGGTFTMDVEEAIEAVEMIRPKIVVPIHGTKEDAGRFARLAAERTATEVVVLQPRERMSVFRTAQGVAFERGRGRHGP